MPRIANGVDMVQLPWLSSPAKAGDPVTTKLQFGHGISFTNGTGITRCPAFAGHDTALWDVPLDPQHYRICATTAFAQAVRGGPPRPGADRKRCGPIHDRWRRAGS